MAASDPTVWVRCEDPARLAALSEVASRLAADGDRVRFLITVRNKTEIHEAHPRGGQAITAFLTHHAPLFVLYMGGILDSNTLYCCEIENVPVIAIDARADTLREMTGGWFSPRPKSTITGLTAAFARDARTAETLTKLGVPPDRVFAFGTLERSAAILPFREEERNDMAQTLRNRPVWLARGLVPQEAEAIALAHRHASRRAHRLMLCITPDNPLDSYEIAHVMAIYGFQIAIRSRGDVPHEAHQVYLVDMDGLDGLWLRLAPISCAGGTFSVGARHDPFEAAALGSVVVHGLRTEPHEERFRRLIRAGASLAVNDPASLGPTIETLLAPDRTAKMAMAGWDVTSTGAEISNRIVAMIQERLDKGGVRV